MGWKSRNGCPEPAKDDRLKIDLHQQPGLCRFSPDPTIPHARAGKSSDQEARWLRRVAILPGIQVEPVVECSLRAGKSRLIKFMRTPLPLESSDYCPPT